MPCLESERLERLRDFLSQQNTQIAADYFAVLGSHDPIFVEAVAGMAIGSEKFCAVVSTKLEAHNAIHDAQESINQFASA